VDGKSQDAKAHDGQLSAGPVTEEQVQSRDGSQVMSGVHSATDDAVEDDVAQDEDGKTSV